MGRERDFEDNSKVPTQEGTGSKVLPFGAQQACLLVLAGGAVGELHRLSNEVTAVGRDAQSDVRLDDPQVSRRHLRLERQGNEMVLLDQGSRNGTFVNGERATRVALRDGDKIRLGATVILKFTLQDQVDESFQRHLYESALLDGLTRVYNKKYFLQRIESETAFAQRHKTALSLILFDIDHFKRVNDNYGHLAGDQVLSAVASTVGQTARKEDVVARFGGEEFAIISRGIDRNGAAAFAERIRRRVEQQSAEHTGQLIRVTVSLGAAELPTHPLISATELIQRADRAMYQAKRDGRNRVVLAP